MTSEISAISFQLTRHSIHRSMSQDRKAIRYKTRILVSQSMTMN